MSFLDNLDLSLHAEIANVKNTLWQKYNARYEYGIASGGAWSLALTRAFGGSSATCDGGQDYASIKRQLNLVGIDAKSEEAKQVVHCSPEWAFKLGHAQLQNYAPIALSEGASMCMVFVITSHIGIEGPASSAHRCCILGMQMDLSEPNANINAQCEYYKAPCKHDLKSTDSLSTKQSNRLEHELITTLLLLRLELQFLHTICLNNLDQRRVTDLLDRLNFKLASSELKYSLVSPAFKNTNDVAAYRGH